MGENTMSIIHIKVYGNINTEAQEALKSLADKKETLGMTAAKIMVSKIIAATAELGSTWPEKTVIEISARTSEKETAQTIEKILKKSLRMQSQALACGITWAEEM
jgi:hypothetical protein